MSNSDESRTSRSSSPRVEVERFGLPPHLKTSRSSSRSSTRAAACAVSPGARWAATPATAARSTADLVQRDGGEATVRLVEAAVPFARFRILRRLELGDLASAEGRDRVLGELRDDFSLLAPSAEREELARIAASRLDLSRELL